MFMEVIWRFASHIVLEEGFVLSLYLNYGNVGEGKGVKVFSLVFSFGKKGVWDSL